ncbi:FxSxx-COOH system tetratricopeptide repeat protein [Streptomyces sp. NRRL S-646]|uniref:FxSxx-COOH system tetratricopeptide repeat protein n=1 Tax=Streptomyces sp. NRRL S-646 TaxID=1463917 RepID=UPI0004CAE737|nr:FxSxx-COOH system tetratricopeptide repeat protein [Streptomyces sp. NRRL S-646]
MADGGSDGQIAVVMDLARRTLGSGFLVAANHVLACAHVVADALEAPAGGERPRGQMLVQLPELPRLRPGQARPAPAGLAMSRTVPSVRSALLEALRSFTRGAFALDLVVEGAPSMDVWDDKLAQFAAVLGEGPFHGVRVCRLDTSAPGPLRCVGEGGRAVPADERLGERRDVRVLLLATDTLGAAWRDGRMTGLLRTCADHTSLAVMQVLPQRLWFRAGSPVVDVEWCADAPGTPADALHRKPPGLAFARQSAPLDDAVPLIGSDPAELGTWARLTADGDASWQRGLGLLPEPGPRSTPVSRPQDGELVRRFRLTAEPDSVRLAELLAVAPVVTVPLLRGMHRRLLPDRGDFPVTEASLSGLLTPAPVSDAVTERAYVFQPGVADALKSALSPADVRRARSVAEEFLPVDVWESVRLRPPASVGSRPERDAGGPKLEVSYQRLPSRNGYFTCRAGLLEKLRATLTAGGARACVLYGTGGVGKSQTGLEYAHRYQGCYDFVWWMEAASPAMATQALEELRAALGIAPGPSGVPPAAAVLDRLRRGRVRDGWLVVMNNAESPDRLPPLLPHGNGHVIITTRNLSWNQLPDFLPVPVFERAESVSLLRRLVPELPADDANALAERAGDLPRAVVQVGRSLSGFGMDVAAHLAEFDELCATLLQQNDLLDYPVSLVASRQVTLEALGREMPSAVQLFHVLCHLGLGPVPQDPLFSAVGLSMPPGPGAVLRQALPVHQALRRPGDTGLATVDKEIHGIEVHRVLQTIARRRFMDHQQRRQADGAVLCLLAAAVPTSPADPRGRRRLAEIVRRLNLDRALASEPRDVRALVLATVRHHQVLGDVDAARVAAEIAQLSWQSGTGARPTKLEEIRRCLESLSPTV